MKMRPPENFAGVATTITVAPATQTRGDRRRRGSSRTSPSGPGDREPLQHPVRPEELPHVRHRQLEAAPGRVTEGDRRLRGTAVAPDQGRHDAGGQPNGGLGERAPPCGDHEPEEDPEGDAGAPGQARDGGGCRQPGDEAGAWGACCCPEAEHRRSEGEKHRHVGGMDRQPVERREDVVDIGVAVLVDEQGYGRRRERTARRPRRRSRTCVRRSAARRRAGSSSRAGRGARC